MQAGRRLKGAQARGSLVLALADWLLVLVIAFVGALVLWIWLDGPLRLEARTLRNDVPPYLLGGLILAWCALHWRRWPAWLGLRTPARLHLRGPSLFAWLVMPLSLALLSAQALSVASEVVRIPWKVRKSARGGPATMSVNWHNHHAGPLVHALVQRPTSEPVVVWIDDRDARGHTAAFYLYPRLLLMEPQQRRWTLRQRMTERGGPNPLFSLGRRPSKALSQAFADERGTQLVLARRPGGDRKR